MVHCCGWLYSTTRVKILKKKKKKNDPLIQHEAMKKYRRVEVELHAFWTSVLQVSSQKRKENYIKEDE